MMQILPFRIKSVYYSKYFLGALLILMPGSSIQAQNDSLPFTRHTFHAEIFGHGLLYSVNYDFRFHRHAALHVGFSHWGFNSAFFGELRMTAFPVTIIYLSGKDDHHLEIGAGIMPAKLTFVNSGIFSLFSGNEVVKKRSDALIGIGSIGYRYQPMDGGLMLRVAITPFYNNKFVFYAGASAGISF
ncbi:MAG: hypothetical protein IPP46_14580 [Bacteroidetes bacterium]|nr:hypothetical protein [Bacteroidota bacterium]